MDKDVQLAKQIIKKIRELLQEQFCYIVNFAPQVKFYESCDELFLESIYFEADGNYQDAIIVTATGVMLSLEEGQYQVLLHVTNFDDILNLTIEDIDALRPDIEASIVKPREEYLSRN